MQSFIMENQLSLPTEKKFKNINFITVSVEQTVILMSEQSLKLYKIAKLVQKHL